MKLAYKYYVNIGSAAEWVGNGAHPTDGAGSMPELWDHIQNENAIFIFYSNIFILG